MSLNPPLSFFFGRIQRLKLKKIILGVSTLLKVNTSLYSTL